MPARLLNLRQRSHVTVPGWRAGRGNVSLRSRHRHTCLHALARPGGCVPLVRPHPLRPSRGRRPLRGQRTHLLARCLPRALKRARSQGGDAGRAVAGAAHARLHARAAAAHRYLGRPASRCLLWLCLVSLPASQCLVLAFCATALSFPFVALVAEPTKAPPCLLACFPPSPASGTWHPAGDTRLMVLHAQRLSRLLACCGVWSRREDTWGFCTT